MKNIIKAFSFLLLFLVLSFSSQALAVTSNVGKKLPNFNFSHPKKTEMNLIQDPSHFLGTVNTITDSTITLDLKNGKKNTTSEIKTITPDAKTTIVKDKNKIKMTDIKVGDTLQVNMERVGLTNFRVRNIRVLTKLLKTKSNK